MRNGFILAIAFLAAACPEVTEIGEPCGTYSICAGDSRCIDGTCTECGGPGEACCPEQGEECDIATMACVEDNEGFGVCDGECGKVGMECCVGDDPCPVSGTCQLGTCTALGVDDDCHDPNGQDHVVYVIDATCQAHPHHFQTATAGKAEECSQALLSNDVEVCPIGVEPDQTKTCSSYLGSANSPHTFSHCSDAWFQACKSEVCFDCGWSDVADLEDPCPLVP
jgi:hypothetical protein